MDPHANAHKNPAILNTLKQTILKKKKDYYDFWEAVLTAAIKTADEQWNTSDLLHFYSFNVASLDPLFPNETLKKYNKKDLPFSLAVSLSITGSVTVSFEAKETEFSICIATIREILTSWGFSNMSKEFRHEFSLDVNKLLQQ